MRVVWLPNGQKGVVLASSLICVLKVDWDKIIRLQEKKKGEKKEEKRLVLNLKIL
jgi:hypothetical protein